MAFAVSRRSLCARSRVGAVIVDRENRIVSTGYNGPPAGFHHSDRDCREWCPRGADPDGGTVFPCYSVHAEANALLSGDRSAWQGGTMYATKHPCWECAKLIANSGLNYLHVRTLETREEDHRSYAVYDFIRACGLGVAVIE
jgi:dCMP deaminase